MSIFSHTYSAHLKQVRNTTNMSDKGQAGETPESETSTCGTSDLGTNTLPMSELSKLINGSISKQDIVATIHKNMDKIFMYSLQDVRDVLNVLDMDVLVTLHRALIEQVALTFTQYQNRRAINRQAKHKIITDICHMGYSIVNKQPMKELDKIFVPKEGNTPESGKDVETDSRANVSDMQDLIQSYADMYRQMELMKDELKKVKDDSEHFRAQFVVLTAHNAMLEKELDSLKSSRMNGAPRVTSPESQDDLSDQGDDPSDHENDHIWAKILSKKSRVTSPESLDDLTDAQSDLENDQTFAKVLSKKSRKRAGRTAAQLGAKRQCISSGNNVKEFTPNTQVSLKAAAVRTGQSVSVKNGTPHSDQSHSTADLYVGFLDIEHKAEDVSRFIQSNFGVRPLNVQDLSSRQGASWRSFRVTVSSDCVDTVINSPVWPAGIRVRMFRKQNSNKGPQTTQFRVNAPRSKARFQGVRPSIQLRSATTAPSATAGARAASTFPAYSGPSWYSARHVPQQSHFNPGPQQAPQPTYCNAAPSWSPADQATGHLWANNGHTAWPTPAEWAWRH